MKKFKVTVVMSTVLTHEIEAETQEEAWELAINDDGSNYTEVRNSGSWDVCDVVEMEAANE